MDQEYLFKSAMTCIAFLPILFLIGAVTFFVLPIQSPLGIALRMFSISGGFITVVLFAIFMMATLWSR